MSKKKGLITGCFDILHIGHLSFFEKAKAHVDELFVYVESDESTKRFKGDSRPIFSEDIRKKALESVKNIDRAEILYHDHDYSKDALINFYKSTYSDAGVDCVITTKKSDSFWKTKRGICSELGIELILLDAEFPDVSTSAILQKVVNL